MGLIYIADDSADQRYLLSYFIKRINPEYLIVSFEKAQALLDALSFVIESDRTLPKMIFLDLQMPEMDGFSALQVIKKSGAEHLKWAEVPVVIYSSHSDKDTIQKCLDEGAIAFIQKPANPGELKNLFISVQP